MSTLGIDLSVRRHGFRLHCEHQFPERISAITGASGAGKSTLFDALCGDLPCEGSIELGGQILVDSHGGIRTAPHRRGFRRVYQDARLFPHLDVQSNIYFGARGERPLLDSSELFETLQIEGLLQRDIRSLSGGEQQRVAVARALLSGPVRALLFDEALSGVDRPHRRRILLALKRWQQQLGVPMLYVCHNAEEALLVADHCIALADGKLVDSGTPARVLGSAVADTDSRVLLLTTVQSHSPDAGLSELRWGDRVIEAPLCAPAPGESIVVELAARDVVICGEKPTATSARNCVRASLEELKTQSRSLLLARFLVEGTPTDGPGVLGCVTPSAAAELDLTTGREYWLLFKSSALRIL